MIGVSMAPDKIGPYLIEKKIGAGGMGTVYLGRHAETGQEAAVKVLPASLAREEGFVARFTREIDSLKVLKNPHVVELYESGVDEETYFYAMEYVEGETLTQRLRRDKRMPWQEVIDITVQICSALKAAHDAGIIHRDLKPSNLLISPGGDVKLTDFGVAQVFAGTKLTRTGGIIGTAEYMSPEQAKGHRATKQSDLYSLGAVVYVMLTGRPPFSGKTTLDVIHKHQYARFERPSLLVPEIPFWLEDVVCQLMEKDPDKRFADAYVLSRKLQEILRKVELSSQEDTLGTAELSGGTGATVALDGTSAAPAGPGHGTLMRDLLRAEIEHAQRPSPIARVFDNTYVLLAALALLVGGGFWWFQRGQLEPEERLELVKELLVDGEGWREAEEHVLVLLAEDRARWEPVVAPFVEQIELYKIEQGRRGPLRKTPNSEADLFLHRAEHFRDVGDFQRAEETLTSLVALLEDSPEHKPLLRFAQRQLDELRLREDATADKFPLLLASMSKADRLAEDGQIDEAQKIWTAIVELYVSDPEAAGEVRRARERLAQLKTAAVK